MKLEKEVMDARIDKCIWKCLMDGGNKLYINLSFKIAPSKSTDCMYCNGYHKRKVCYETIKYYGKKE